MGEVFRTIRQVLPPWPSFWRCALTGAFGIASGFAVFLLWLDHISHEPVRFVIGLGVAVLVAFVFDMLKDELEGRKHHWEAPRLLVLVVLLAIAELFIIGFHSTAELKAVQLQKTLHTLLGEKVTEWHAFGVVGIWLVLGAAIAVGLGATIFRAGCEIPDDAPLSWSRPWVWGRPMLRSAIRGGLTGAVAGPLCMLFYIFVARVVGGDYFSTLADPAKWRRHLRGAGQMVGGPSGWLISVPIELISMLDGAFGVAVGRFGPVLTLAALVAVLALCARVRAYRVFVVLLVTMAIVYVYPVLADTGRALRLAGLMAYLWAVPGVLLGALTPWLKRPAGYPKLWGTVAFGAAVVLVIGAVAIPWFILPALAFAAVGFWFLWGIQVEQYWAVLALSVATNVFGATHIVTRADFFHIQRDSFELTKIPVQVFSYRDPVVDRIAEALRQLRESDAASKPLPSELWLRQSPLFPPGTALPTSPYRDRAPWATGGGALEQEAQLARQLAALRAERDRIATLLAAFTARLDELGRMQSEHDKAQTSIVDLGRLGYHEQHERLQTAGTWAATAVEQRKKVVTEATTTLGDEVKRGIPGPPQPAGDVAPSALTRQAAIRDEQTLLWTERDKLLALVQQVRERGEGLEAPLTALKDAVEKQLGDLHNMALRALEVALTASSGFWITLGLLASWSIRRGQASGAPPAGAPHV